ncbi:hypothetical protein ACFUOZ_08130 [Paenarthrobacter sp. NPDC057355]|jgi:hypothetical protein|uniref:hypothetical protein n=1 Tax=Paenarthrobacter TaxID=1742992 RepID=UPI0009A809E0|nr:hypothetical protein [Paenarthrobacter nicotinovorans]MDI2022234.1 hypothetical protein [Paenarthrobacter nicotinovorans]SKB90312.1 hypothetical protein SAMN05660916_03248 [Arthrobacter sp. 31Cvi3.1E]
MSASITRVKRDISPAVAKAAKVGGVTAALFATLSVVFQAVATLGISSGLATNLYFALNALSWAALAAGIVASFGIGTALAGVIFGLVKRWALKQFVAW